MWYMNIGVELCFTIFTSSISSNINVVLKIGRTFIQRWFDRSLKPTVKKNKDDEYDDEIWSKKATQEDVEELYKGAEFQGQKSFSRMMSVLTVCILYSSGMPALYIVGFIFFTATFVV